MDALENARQELRSAHRVRDARAAEDARIARDQQEDRAENRHVERGERAEVRHVRCEDCHRRTVIVLAAEIMPERLGVAVRIRRNRMPRLHAERQIRIREREDQNREDQADRRARNDGGRPLRFLRGLRDRLEPDEGDDRERHAVHQVERRRPRQLHRMDQEARLKCEQEAEEEDRRFADDVETADEFVECRTFADADDVEQREPRDHGEHDREVDPRMCREAQDRYELAQVIDAAPREQHDVDREIEQHGPTRDESEDIPEAAEDEILSPARNRVGRGEFGVGQADAHVHDPGEEERDVGGARRRAEHEAQPHEDIGADVGVAPRKRAPWRNGASE